MPLIAQNQIKFKEDYSMANLKDSISNAIGNSKIFNKTVDYLGEQQKRFKLKKALDDAKNHLNDLFNELGRTSYNKKALSPGRTSTVIREEISVVLAEIDELQKAYDEMVASKPDQDEPISEDSETAETE